MRFKGLSLFRSDQKQAACIITIGSRTLLFSNWHTNRDRVVLDRAEHVITELPLYINGYISNLPLLARLTKEHVDPQQTNIRYHLLLDLDHTQEQLVFCRPEETIAQPTDISPIVQTHQPLFTLKNGTNVWLQTNVHVATLVQLQLLANSLAITLGLVSSFSHACLAGYYLTRNQTERTQQLQQELQQAEYDYTRLFTPKQLLSCVDNAPPLEQLYSRIPSHVTANISAILSLLAGKIYEDE